MNENQIAVFMEVANSMSFSAASEKLYISQPSVSKHITKLEEELGEKLFDRSSKKIALTQAGIMYYNFFHITTENFKAVKKEIEEYTKTSMNMVNLAILSSMNSPDCLFSDLDSLVPGVKVNVYFYSFHELLDALLDRTVDIIIGLDDFMPDIPNVSKRKLKSIPKVIVYHKDLLDTNDNTFTTPCDFKKQDFLVIDEKEAPLLTTKVVEYCNRYGFSPKIRSVPNIETMLAGVKYKKGVAIIDVWAEICTLNDIRTIPFDENHVVSIQWKNDNTKPSVKKVINALIKIMETK